MLELDSRPFKTWYVVTYWAMSLLVILLSLVFVLDSGNDGYLYYLFLFVLAATVPTGVFLIMPQKVVIDTAEERIRSCFRRLCFRNLEIKDIVKVKYGDRGGMKPFISIYFRNRSPLMLESWHFEAQSIKLATELILSLSDRYGFEIERVEAESLRDNAGNADYRVK